MYTLPYNRSHSCVLLFKVIKLLLPHFPKFKRSHELQVKRKLNYIYQASLDALVALNLPLSPGSTEVCLR